MSGLEEKLINVTKAIEKQVDAVIDRLDNLDTNELDQIRLNRIKELQKQEEQRKVWLSNDHGKYEELAEEKMFFDIIKKSENVVIHFYRNGSPRCAIVDKHLKILADKHIETRFIKLDAEKCPFLAENLKIKTIPSIVLVQKSIMVDKIVGFTQLGNRDDFTTELLEWRIAHNKIINYEGDLSTPPHLQDKVSKGNAKTIRSGFYNGDDDLDVEDYSLTKLQLQSNSSVQNTHTELTPEEAAELGIE
ncbi:hypothetical protein NQ317_016405 [Molorchus minor]|uniref:Thioredoxin domain-containing protein 9 n=1 Tax=Molorchus minor TaxID=1323400 RepID=A0ABQ9J894_9CUCU|nr:hypothetical protein NQ317_016405 [Molorchus minor]